ncbi:MAG: CoA pyrophosphatase [Phycisphaerae bacterium]|nr:CoA pyrophosphatase [Phycisphaerae bacterium]
MTINYDNLRSALAGAAHPPARDARHPCAVCLPLLERGDTHILFIQKADTAGYHWRNQIALPGGHITPQDRSITDAALRELNEELGIQPQELDVLGHLGHFQTATSDADLGVVVVRWNGGRTPVFDPREVARILPVPLQSLAEIHVAEGFVGQPAADIAGRLEYRTAGVRIWGVTARILHSFLELLRSPGAVGVSPAPDEREMLHG